MQAALFVCYRFGVSLSELLCGQCPVERSIGSAQGQIYLRPSRCSAPIDWLTIEGNMRTRLKGPRIQAISLAHFSREAGIAVRTLRSRFPKLCRRMAAAYRRRRELEIARGERVLTRKMRLCARVLRKSGCEISQKRIGVLLGEPRLFDRHAPRRVFVALFIH